MTADSAALAIRRAIRAERSRLGLSQGELAERLGWSRQSVARMESGTRVVGAHELPALCSALECDLGRLLILVDADDKAALGL